MKIFTFFKKSIVLAGAVLFGFLFAACDVGLGESVDVEEPKVDITYPPAASVIRSSFVAAGTCSDDKGVAKVTVNIYNSDKNIDCGTFTAELSGGKRWTCDLNTPDEKGNYPLSDGNYVIKVIATDKADRNSGAASQSVFIDNTAPVFVMTAPGSTTIERSTTYGSILKISGQIAEDRKVDYVTLSVFDKNKNKIASWTNNEINISGTTNVTFAKYISNPKAVKDALHNNYVSIYDAEKGGLQEFYCTVEISDNAGLWQTPVYSNDGNIVSDDKKDGYTGEVGNVSSTVWLNDDIYGQDAAVGDLLSKNAEPQFEIGDLRDLLNGNFSKSYVTEDQKTKALEIIRTAAIDTSEKEKYLAFKMNKDANPTYNFMGYSFSGIQGSGENVASKGGALTLKADSGLDGTTFSPGTIKVYMFGPYSDVSAGSVTMISEEILDKIFYDTDNYIEQNPELVHKLYDGENGVAGKANSGPYSGTSVTSWTNSVYLPEDIMSGSVYIVALTGTDKDQMEFLPQGTFGFKGKSSGQAPDVGIKSPKSDSLARNVSNLTVSGTVQSFDGSKISVIYYETVVSDMTSGEVLGKITGTSGEALRPADGSVKITEGELGVNSSVNYEIDLTKGTWTSEDGVTSDPRILKPLKDSRGQVVKDDKGNDLPEEVMYKYTCIVYGSDATGLAGKGSVITQIDTKRPDASISSVGPIAKSEVDGSSSVYMINGTINISGSASDQNLEDVELEVTGYNKGTGAKDVVKTFNLGRKTFFNVELDTSIFADGNLTIALKVTDKAGNKMVVSENEYKVDADSDRPVITSETSSTLAMSGIRANENLFGTTSNNKFAATITDDDGVGKVIVTVYKENGTTEVKKETVQCGGKTSYNLSYELPKTEGKFVIELYAVDKLTLNESDIAAKKDLSSTRKTRYNIGIDAGIPSLQFTVTNKGMIAANASKTVTGTASDSSGLKSLVRYGVVLSDEYKEKNKDDKLISKYTTADDDNCVTGSKEAEWVKGGSSNTISYNETTGVWSDTIAASGASGIGSEPGRRRYIATDVYGNETILDFIYVVDSLPPSVQEITFPAEADFVFDGNNILSVKGKVIDDRKEFSKVMFTVGTSEPAKVASPIDGSKYIYDTTKGTWETAVLSSFKNKDLNESTNFTANVDLSDGGYADGKYKVFIAVFDEANNQSYVAANTTVSLVSDKISPELSFDSVPEFNKTSVTLFGRFVETNLKSLILSGKVYGNNSTLLKSIPATQVSPIDWVNHTASHAFTDAGKYELTIVATDKAEHTDSKNVSFTIDNVLPTIKADPTVNYTNGDWRNSTTQTIQVLVGDTGTDGKSFSCGIDSVKYFLDSDTTGVEVASGAARDSSGKTTGGLYYNIFKSTFNVDSDGSHTVKVRVTDKAGNSADTSSFTYKIDTTAPTVTSAVPSKDGFNTASLADFTVTVSAVDGTGSGVASIEIKKGTDSVVTKAYSGSSVSLTVPKSKITDGSNIFAVYAVDKAGNTSVAKTFSVDYDSVKPVVNITSVSPVAAVDNGVNYVNGTISVRGTVNDTNTESIKLTVTGGGKTKEYVIPNASSFIQDVDTTYFATGTAKIPLTFTLYAKDTAGNDNTISETGYTADQTTDAPVIDAGDTSTAVSLSQIAANKNLFGTTSNNKFTATVSDDDGVRSVSVTVKDSSGTVISGAGLTSYGLSGGKNPFTYDGADKGSYKFNYTLPVKEGKYILVVSAADKYGLSKSWTYNIGIDAGNPDVAFTVTNNARVGANIAKVVTGTATDSSGVYSIYRYATSSNDDNSTISGTPQAQWVKGGSSNTITYNEGTGVWSDTIAATGASGIGTVSGRRRYVVTDIYGNESQRDFIYGVDNEAPVIRGITTPLSVSAENVYNGNNIYSVIGKVSDNFKEFDRVLFYVGTSAPSTKASPIDGAKTVYDTTKGNWETAVLSTSKNDDAYESTTFTCNVNLKEKADGVYRVYIAAFDQALIQTYADSNYVVKLTSDKTEPAITVNPIKENYNSTDGLTSSTVTLSGTLVEANRESFTITYKVRSNTGSTTVGPVAITPSGNNWTYALAGKGNYEEIKLAAKDKAGFTKEWTGKTLIDDASPVMKLDPTVNYTDGSWKSSTTQRIQVLVADKGDDGKTYSSGISYVKYYLDGDTEGVELAPGSARNASGTTTGTLAYNIYNSTFDVSNGTHTLSLKAVDLAGNVTPAGSYTYKVDDTKPSTPVLAVSSLNLNKSAYESSDVVIKITSSDLNPSAKGGNTDVSKISKITLKRGNTVIKTEIISPAVDSISGRNFTVPKTYKDGAATKDTIVTGTNEFTVYVEDAAGNVSDGSVYTVTADITEPEIAYTSHSAKAVVNKTITLSGTYSDNNEVEATSGKIYVFKADGVTKELVASFNHSGDGTWSYASLNTITYDTDVYGTRLSSGQRPVTFLVQFADPAGNLSSAAKTITLNIDQNSDRPVIKLTNLNTSASVIRSTSAYGTVTDDDGEVKDLWIIEKTVYDGMATKKYPSGANNNGWTKAAVQSGSWSVDTDEGPHSWYFYVMDKAGSGFATTGGTAVSRPYIQGKDDASKVDNNTAVSFTADETGPAVTMYVSHGTASASDGNWKSAGEVFGGTERYLWIKLEITEDVGMKKTGGNYDVPAVTIGGASKAVTFKSTPTVSSGVYTYLLNPVDLKSLSLDDGTVQLSAKVYDSSLQPGNGGVNFIYDNSAPVVQILSPTTAVSDAVTSSVTVKGLVSDNYSSVSRLEWAIPVKANASAYTTTGGDWTTVPASASWEINFSSGASDSVDSLLYYAVTRNAADTDYMYAVTPEGTENIFRIPLWFRVTDSVGNVSVRKTYVNAETGTETDLYVLADSDGGKPKAWISSPENGSTTSGVVTVYGGASDDISVVRVDAAYSFDGTNYTTVTASGTNSWKTDVDTTGKTKLYVKCRAYDEENQTRDWTTPVQVTIDAQTPTIKNLKLVQYGPGNSSGTPVTSRDYIAGMYISNNTVAENGNWYLTGTISDNEKVASVTTSKMSSSTVSVIDLPSVIVNGGTTASYKLNVLLDTSSTGQIYSIMKASDGKTFTEQTIKINIDSTLPSLYNTSNAQSTTITDNLRLKSLSKMMGTASSNSSVVNSNGYFTFGDTVIEGESGLAYVAFYFERDGSSENRIYNPMVTNVAGANKTILPSLTQKKLSAVSNGTMFINSDNLPVLAVKGAARASEDSLKLAALGTNKNVRKGGLIKIGGSYSKITNVSSDGTVTFAPGVDKSFINAEIVYAQVVDHQLTESTDGRGNVVNDDGDEMIESVSQIGTSYIWSASLDSTVIPDGPVYIRLAAIDNAGNVTTGKILTNVANNRPRITKVMLGTDLNGNGKYDLKATSGPIVSVNDEIATADGKSYGEFSYYSAFNKLTGLGEYDVELTSENFKVIRGLMVVPEFTGGNNNLKYVLNYGTKASEPATSSTPVQMTPRSTLVSAINQHSLAMFNNSETASQNVISIRDFDFGGISLASSHAAFTTDKKTYLNFTFWDATEETTQGTNSQWALLKVPVTVKVNDSVQPVAKIKPFYWKDKTDNSVHRENGVLQGHIELESDLTSSITSLLGSDDPKVSGKIKIEGIVTDDVLLSSITANVFGNSGTVGKYTNGTWVQNSTLPAGVVSFSAEDIDMSQNGHTVKYTIVVDTESVTGVSAKDKVIKIGATDWKSNASTAGSSQTAKASLVVNDVSYDSGTTDYYKMDVVPYITQIWTELSETKTNNPSMYARSSTGEYVVRGKTSGATYKDAGFDGERITVYGWNLNGSPAVRLGSTVLSGTSVSANTNENVKQGTYGISFTVPDRTSNELNVTVNSILSLNNLNNNDAKGSASADTETYDGYYNRQPNGDNNNTLTDDVRLDIWDFKNAVTPAGTAAKYVHMKVGPYLSTDSSRSGRIGFSFRNGAGFFNMPGYMYIPGSSSTVDTMTKKQIDLYIKASLGYVAIHYWGTSVSGDTSAPVSMGSTVSYNGSTYYHYVFNTNLTANGNGTLDDMHFILTKKDGGWDSQTNGTSLTSVGEYIIDSAPGTSLSPTHKSAYISSQTVSSSTVFSQTKIGQNFQGFSHNTFTFDANGDTYGAALCSDTSGNDEMSANFQFFSRGYGESSDSLNFNYYNCINGRRIENTKNTAGTYDEERVKSPSMATYVSGGKTYVYMAYWDHLENRIIFRVGSVDGTGSANANKIGLGLRDLCGETSHHTNYDKNDDVGKIGSSGFARRNSTDSSYTGDTRSGEASAYHYVKILESFSGVTDAHVSVAALSDGSAVVAWYNDVSQTLKAVRISNADMVSQTLNTKSYTPVTVSRNGGAYVSVAADSANGLHFAYASNSGANLYYAYANSSLSGINEMLVDVSDDVGDNCTIDVARNTTSGPWIPVITYKSNVATGTKIAYPVFGSSATSSTRPSAGSTTGGQYTGAWAICTLPTSNKSISDLVSVGYNKSWSDGTYKAFTEISELSVATSGKYTICDSTVISGNGTSNPVVGYGIATGSIELAQKR